MKTKHPSPLEKSIEHWKRLRDDPSYSSRPRRESCDLCRLYLDNNCRDCPVAEASGKISCRGTPFMAAYDAFFNSGRNTPDFMWAADAEVKFLEALLPKQSRWQRFISYFLAIGTRS